MARRKITESYVKSALHSDRVGTALIVVAMAIRLGWRAGRVVMTGIHVTQHPAWSRALVVETVSADGSRGLVGWGVHDQYADRWALAPEYTGSMDLRLRAATFDEVARAILGTGAMPDPSEHARSADTAASQPPPDPRMPPELNEDWSDWS